MAGYRALWFVVAVLCLSCCYAAEPWKQPGAAPGDEITGPDGLPMVWVPAGEFTMGSNDADADKSEQPPHRVRLSGFWIQKYEVTNQAFKAFCDATGYTFPPESTQPLDEPVCALSWIHCNDYATHYGLKRPTEAQWEYAGRGPSSLVYPWGNAMGADDICCWWFHRNENPGRNTFAVGANPSDKSWCGVYDLAGNIREWVYDLWDEKYYSRSPVQDPTGPAGQHSRMQGCVLRGGDWFTARDEDLRLYRRSSCRLSTWDRLAGFRCAYTPQ